MNIKEKNIVFSFILLSFISIFLIIIRVYLTNSTKYLFFIWNLFLCLIPFVLSIIIYIRYNKSKTGIIDIILSLIWLLFYPNAPYMLTDLIHLTNLDFYNNKFLPFNNQIYIWFDFILFLFFILTGFLIGFYSLYLMQNIIIKYTFKAYSYIFVCTVLILSSFAIYLGRFIRLNSWDIINPINLFNIIIKNININSISFTLLFSLLLISIYTMLYKLANNKI